MKKNNLTRLGTEGAAYKCLRRRFTYLFMQLVDELVELKVDG
jgi:hypothetical protein